MSQRGASRQGSAHPICARPTLDDPGARGLHELEIQSREHEVRKTLALINYVSDYVAQGRQARIDEEAAIMYAAQALGWSEYRTARLHDHAVMVREKLPSVWRYFCEARVTSLALGKIAQAVVKLASQEAIAELDTRAPEPASKYRPGELDRWLKRFLARAEPGQHALRCAHEARSRYVSVRPAEDSEGMSVLTAILPSVTAQAIAHKLQAMARSHMQPVPHNPAVTGLQRAGQSNEAASGGAVATGRSSGPRHPGTFVTDPSCQASGEHRSADVPPIYAEAGFTSSEEDWWGDWVETLSAALTRKPDRRAESMSAPESYAEGDERTLAQRQADLFCSWLLRGEQAEALPVEAHIGLLVPLETLTGGSDAPALTRDRSDAVPAEAIRHLIGDPANSIRWHQMMVSGSPTTPSDDPRHVPRKVSAGEGVNVLSHSYSGYQVPKVLRQALWFRDGHCQAIGCTAPAERGDIDHITAWPHGPTAAENLQVLCRRHHRIKTAGHHFTSQTKSSVNYCDAAVDARGAVIVR